MGSQTVWWGVEDAEEAPPENWDNWVPEDKLLETWEKEDDRTVWWEDQSQGVEWQLPKADGAASWKQSWQDWEPEKVEKEAEGLGLRVWGLGFRI